MYVCMFANDRIAVHGGKSEVKRERERERERASERERERKSDVMFKKHKILFGKCKTENEVKIK